MRSEPRVLIVAPPLPGICEGVQRGFEAVGCRVDLFRYRLVAASSWKRLIGFDYEKQRRRYFNRLLRSLIPRLRSTPPDLVLILKGAEPDRDVAQGWREAGIPTALWTYDSLMRIPGQQGAALLADHVFYMDGGDAAGENSTWLPLGYDNKLYYREDGEKRWDVLFVGRLGRGYKSRLRALGELVRCAALKRYRVGLMGSTGSRLTDRKLELGGVHWIAGHMPPDEFARNISNSRICINVHQDDGIKPVNPTFFAIPGTGVCQVADDREYLGKWLEPGEEYVPFAEEGLCDVIIPLLEGSNRREQVAAAGYRAAVKQHTFSARAKTILSRFGMEPD